MEEIECPSQEELEQAMETFLQTADYLPLEALLLKKINHHVAALDRSSDREKVVAAAKSRGKLLTQFTQYQLDARVRASTRIARMTHQVPIKRAAATLLSLYDHFFLEEEKRSLQEKLAQVG